jgi:hypothetical protein
LVERLAVRVVFLGDRLAVFLPAAFFGERVAFRFVAFLVIAISLAPPERAPETCATVFPLGALRGEAAQFTLWLQLSLHNSLLLAQHSLQPRALNQFSCKYVKMSLAQAWGLKLKT